MENPQEDYYSRKYKKNMETFKYFFILLGSVFGIISMYELMRWLFKH